MTTTPHGHSANGTLSDVVILGGGPAAAIAARLLAVQRHTVVVLARPAAKPPLAESLPPSAGKLLDRVGVRSGVDAAGFIRATGNTVWWGASEPRIEAFGAGTTGWQLRRDRFDDVLLAEAKVAGATLIRDAVVRDVRLGAGPDDTSLVDYDRRGRTASARAHWVLDCTGRSGLVARHGWRRPDPAGRTLALAAVWERRAGWDALPDATHTVVESYDGGWAWSVPTSRGRRYVTVMVDPGITPVRGADAAMGLTTVYDAELRKASRLHALVHGGQAGRRGARLVTPPFARDASSYAATRVAENGVLLVGDAASFVDPLSSFGIKKALSSAWLASVVVHTLLIDDAMRSGALELFERREHAIVDALRRRFAELSRDAGGETTDFWRRRATSEPGEEGDADVESLRQDRDVLAAFDALRGRDSIALSPSRTLARVERPTVRGDRVVLEEHLVVPAFQGGVRYLRNVDLVRVVALAPEYDQVPDLFAAYSRAAGPAPLPDFLGALSVLVGKGILDLA